jgi:hypothetical protein
MRRIIKFPYEACNAAKKLSTAGRIMVVEEQTFEAVAPKFEAIEQTLRR